MKFVISQGKIKRIIEGDFWICASKHDLTRLVACIKDKLATQENFCYGWVGIHPSIPFDIPEGSPEPWGLKRRGLHDN